MKGARFILIVVLVLASTSFLNAQADSGETALEMTHKLLTSALTSGNLTTLSAMIHPRALGFYRQSQSVVQLRAEYSAADALPSVLDDLSKFTTIATETVYRTIGNTGIVCMSTASASKQGNKKVTRYLRSTWVYINADSNWKLLSWHSSEVPLTKK